MNKPQPSEASTGPKRPRAASMPAEDRRQAIVVALVPLLIERGGDVSTREIAEAAGVAEGTIFRVFADKRALMLAAAREAISPGGRQVVFDDIQAGGLPLREQIVLVAERVQDRMRVTMSVMLAVRSELMNETGPGRRQRPSGPPHFIVEAEENLHRRLTGLFEPHRAELGASPAAAALALRSLIVGSARPELGRAAVLTPKQIADLVLYGVHKRGL